MPDATFTPSSFGGGWLMPHSEAGRDLVHIATGQGGDPPWPQGFIVEPYEVREMYEWAEIAGVAIA